VDAPDPSRLLHADGVDVALSRASVPWGFVPGSPRRLHLRDRGPGGVNPHLKVLHDVEHELRAIECLIGLNPTDQVRLGISAAGRWELVVRPV
jgi:hypothetical protein